MNNNEKNTLKAKHLTNITNKVIAQIFSDGTFISPEVYYFTRECVKIIQLYNKILSQI